MSPPALEQPPNPLRRATIPHLPALDGLRGLAVLGVLLFHDGRLDGGYLGVDLFFVLSGYLIHSLLLAEWAKAGTIDLKAFWVRRARRLFPALLALLPVVAAYAQKLAKPEELDRIRKDGLATLAYVANWRAIFSGRSYWDMFQVPSPLEHTWSLAIEEQFYVVWPLLAFGVLYLSRGSRRVMLAVSLGLAVISGAVMVWLGNRTDTSRAYMGTDTRGVAILLGASLACLMAERGTSKNKQVVRALDGLGLLAAIGLAWAWVKLDGQNPLLYRGGFFGTELCVLVLIVCAAHGEQSLVARALAFRPVAWVGLVSYGLYLWHWPIYVVLRPERIGLSGLGLSALRYTATFAVALISYHFLEQPIRKRGAPFGRPAVMLSSSVALCIGALLVGTQSRRVMQIGLQLLPWPETVPPGTVKILIVGDSVAQALGERMKAVQTGTGAFVIERGTPDCSIMEGTLPARSLTNVPHDGGDCDARWGSDVDELHPDATLVVLGGGYFARVEVEGRWQHICEPGWDAAYAKELGGKLAMLADKGGRVYVARVPYPVGGWQKPALNAQVDCFNTLIEKAAQGEPRIHLLDLAAHLCPGGQCALMSEGEPIRPDGMHFGGPGAKEIARWVIEQVKEPRR
ncbi:acyltransferase family protein [Polyangium mundeleinium]|uniref:Acyltransferase family protein n=1 Tax=Polyangium mundeleinium TaxID=2995306 RepID=A0ABT5F7E5_9BACT|nr:acyltransferase family protein [Polyangium mundeleinium]MDC0749037.1 acyltransferase family protein [Polyangium mundeleinium]